MTQQDGARDAISEKVLLPELQQRGAETRVEGGGVFRRRGGGVFRRRTVLGAGPPADFCTGRHVSVEEPWQSAGFEAPGTDRGVDLWIGNVPADRVRRNPCAQATEVRREFATSAVAAIELPVGVLFLLADKLRVEAAFVESTGGAVMVLPGSTLCLIIGISETDALAWGSWKFCWRRSARRIFRRVIISLASRSEEGAGVTVL